MTTLLDLEPDGFAGRLRVGSGAADLVFRRAKSGALDMTVLGTRGGLEVVRA